MNKSFLTTRLLLMLGVVAAGTASAQENTSIPPSGSLDSCNRIARKVEGHGNLVEYYGSLRSASSEEQAKQHNCAVSIAKSGKSRDKLALALTLIIPETPFADFARAKTLLEKYLQHADGEKQGERDLAVLMLALLDEIGRLEEQLDQLKEIEKDITETEQSVNVPTPAPEPTPAVNDELEEKDTTSR